MSHHPHELLADLLDGTLDADARARVEAHLATCATCRDDLGAAGVGRDAARALPVADAPAGLHDRIAETARRDRGDSRTRAPGWYPWAGVAAAAVLVGVVILSLPEIGAGPDAAGGSGATRAEAAPDAAGGTAPALEASDRNFRRADLTELASREASFGAAAPSVASAPTGDGEAAAGCVARAFEGHPSGRLVRLIRARFEGRPAYLAVYLEGPGAGEEPDTVVVWVASADDCSVLSFAQARL